MGGEGPPIGPPDSTHSVGARKGFVPPSRNGGNAKEASDLQVCLKITDAHTQRRERLALYHQSFIVHTSQLPFKREK